MSRRPHVAPLWSDAPSDLAALKLSDHVHLAEPTIERAIGQLLTEQEQYLARLELPTVRRRPTYRPAGNFTGVAARRPTGTEPVLARHTEPAADFWAGVHPRAKAHALKLADGDVGRCRILGPNQVKVLNR